MSQLPTSQWQRASTFQPPQPAVQSLQQQLMQDAAAHPANASVGDMNTDDLLKEIWEELDQARVDMEDNSHRDVKKTCSQTKPKTPRSRPGRYHRKTNRQYLKRKQPAVVSNNSTVGRTSKSRSSAHAKAPTVPPSSQLDHSKSLTTPTTSAPKSSIASVPLSNNLPTLPMTITVDAQTFLTRGFDAMMPQLFPNSSPSELAARIAIYKPLFLELVTPHLAQINPSSIADLVTLFVNSLHSLQLF